MATEPSQVNHHDHVGEAKAQATLVVSCIATVLVLVNFTAPIPAVQRIGAALGAGSTGQTWILGSFSVGLAASMLVAGSLGDSFGRKRVFVAGGVVFAIATAGGALAPNTVVFVLARVAQGAASAAILAASLALLAHAYVAPAARARATGLWGAMIGAGIAIGPVFVALLLPLASWRVPYWVIALIAAAVSVAAIRSLEESRSPQSRKLDIAGFATLGGGVSFLVAALTQGREGWAQPAVLAFLATGLVLLAVFVWVEYRVAEPMLDLGLLRRSAFVAATAGAFATGVSIIGFMFYVPIAAQRVLGLGALASAGILSIWSGVSFAAAPQARWLIGVLSPRHQVALGLGLAGVGQLALVGISTQSSWWRFVPGLVIAGIGSGLANAALAGMAVQSVPPHHVAMGSGANSTARYVGSSIGIAFLAAVIALASEAGDLAHAFATGMSYAATAAAVLAFLGAGSVALCRERSPRQSNNPSKAPVPMSQARVTAPRKAPHE